MVGKSNSGLAITTMLESSQDFAIFGGIIFDDSMRFLCVGNLVGGEKWHNR